MDERRILPKPEHERIARRARRRLKDHLHYPGSRLLLVCQACDWSKSYAVERIVDRLRQLRAGGYETPVAQVARRVSRACPHCRGARWASQFAYPPGMTDDEKRRIARMIRSDADLTWGQVDRRSATAQTPLVSSVSAPPVQNAALGVTCRVTAMACMAALGAAVKWCSNHGVGTGEIVLFRNLFAFIPLLIYIAVGPGWGVLRTRRPWAHFTRSSLGLLAMWLNFASIGYLPLTAAIALQYTSPLFTTALSALMLGEFVGRHRWAAVAAGFIGVLIMVHPEPGHISLMGLGIGLAGAVAMAGVAVTVRQMAATEHGAAIVFYLTVMGTLVGLIGCAFDWVPLDLRTLGVLAFMGLIGGIGQILTTQAIRFAALGVIAPFDYTQLIWAGLLGYLLWGDVPSAWTISGGLLVAAAGLYILHREILRFRRD